MYKLRIIKKLFNLTLVKINTNTNFSVFFFFGISCQNRSILEFGYHAKLLFYTTP